MRVDFPERAAYWEEEIAPALVHGSITTLPVEKEPKKKRKKRPKAPLGFQPPKKRNA